MSLVGFIAYAGLGCVGVASAIHIYIREKIASIAIIALPGGKIQRGIPDLSYSNTGHWHSRLADRRICRHIRAAYFAGADEGFYPLRNNHYNILAGYRAGNIAWGDHFSAFCAAAANFYPEYFAAKHLTHLVRRYQPAPRPAPVACLWADHTVCRYLFLFSIGYLDREYLFTIGIGIAFLILTFVAWLLMKVVRLIIRNSWSYLLRQGFANLYRPNNQTIILMVSIGLATAFICTLFFIQGMLIKQVSLSSGRNQANMILFDIQTSQQKSMADLTREQKLPVLQQVPIITIRIAQVNGKTEEQAAKDPKSKLSRHAFSYEFRVTYRDTLTPSEKIVDGEWTGKAPAGKDIPVSIEEGLSKRDHIKVGDHLVFNVQGLPISTVVGSIRQVNWNKIQTNFQILFPKGVLEDAPQFYVELTHVPSIKASAKFQQAVVRKFPNVSVIDIGQVVNLLDDLLDKIGYIIKFMSAFSIITGVVVLIASVRISKYQRIQESVLLRTLGASRKQIFSIAALEYLLLGGLSALTGILIAVTGSWLLAKYSFEIPFAVNFLPAAALFVIVAVLTLVIGLINSRGVLSKPPLEILRTT